MCQLRSPPTKKDICLAQDEAPTGSTPVDDDLNKKDATAPLRTPHWEEMAEMLKRIPYFTAAKPSSTKMSDFFPLTKRILVNLDGNPPISVVARLPFGTPESVISRIQPMQDYIAQETTEVVSFASSLV